MADGGQKPDGKGARKISTKDREQGGSVYLHLIRHTGVDFTSKHGAGYVQCMADGCRTAPERVIRPMLTHKASHTE